MLAAVNLDGCASRLLSISGVIHIKKISFYSNADSVYDACHNHLHKQKREFMAPCSA